MESVVEGRPRHRRENDRLNVQHEAVKALMNGKLLRAPVDLNQPGIRVLDSGTAQANWLLDLSQATQHDAQLVGTDIAPEQFPVAEFLPPCISLRKQSIFEPWPREWQSNFDVVHQRFVLAACDSEEQGREAVASLSKLAKPGGWVEIHEGNMMVIQEGPKHQAMMRFRDLAVSVWKKLGKMPDPGVMVSKWLEQAGLQDVQEELQTLKIGAAASDKEQGEDALYLCMNMFDAIQRMMSGRLGFPSEKELRALRTELEEELRQVGNEWRYYLAFGRQS